MAGLYLEEKRLYPPNSYQPRFLLVRLGETEGHPTGFFLKLHGRGPLQSGRTQPTARRGDCGLQTECNAPDIARTANGDWLILFPESSEAGPPVGRRSVVSKKDNLRSFVPTSEPVGRLLPNEFSPRLVLALTWRAATLANFANGSLGLAGRVIVPYPDGSGQRLAIPYLRSRRGSLPSDSASWVQVMLKANLSPGPRLYLVTQGAIAPGVTEDWFGAIAPVGIG